MPGLIALSFFYVYHDDAELVELPPAARLQRIEENVEQNFWIPMIVECNKAQFGQEKLLALVKSVIGG